MAPKENENGEYACEVCGKAYKSKSSYYTHKRTQHKKEEEVRKVSEPNDAETSFSKKTNEHIQKTNVTLLEELENAEVVQTAEKGTKVRKVDVDQTWISTLNDMEDACFERPTASFLTQRSIRHVRASHNGQPLFDGRFRSLTRCSVGEVAG